MPMQPGDVPATWADTTLQEALIGPLPKTPLAEGVARFVEWYRAYHGGCQTAVKQLVVYH